MKILVTGSTGFIGINLAVKLAEQGHIIHALYRSETKIKPIIHPNIILFKGDINNRQSIERAMQGCDSVFHLAACSKVWSNSKNSFYKTNFIGTKNILDIARNMDIYKIVITSTAGVLGPSIDRIVDEETKRRTPFFNEYERTKGMIEELSKRYAAEGMNIVIVNPSRVFGPGIMSTSNSVTRIIQLYYKGQFRIIPGNGKSIGNYAYIDDVVSGHILALNKGKPGERYILGGENLSYNKFFKTIGQIIGKNRMMIKLPLFIMLGISWTMLIIAKIFNIPPLITPELVKKYICNWELSTDKAINELSYKITPFTVAVEETLHYLRKNKKI